LAGFDSTGQSTSSVFVYNPQSNTWSTAAKHAIWASVIGNTIYLPGGATAQGVGATTSHEAFTVIGR
jgi:hypothetical protein